MSALFRLRDGLPSPTVMRRALFGNHRTCSPHISALSTHSPLSSQASSAMPPRFSPISQLTHRHYSSSRLSHPSAQPLLCRPSAPSHLLLTYPTSLSARLLLLSRHASTSTQSTAWISPNIASATASTASTNPTSTPPAPNLQYTTQLPHTTKRRRFVQLTGLAAIVVGLALFTLNHTTASSPLNTAAYEVYVAAYALLRVSRDVWTAGLMVADYSWTLWGLEGEERRQRLEECHWRNADRLKRCFNANGGNTLFSHIAPHTSH